jgi:ERCC4-type nuclease
MSTKTCNIYLDPSETQVEEIENFLKRNNIPYETKSGLPFDYIVACGESAVCIERKDAGDFVSSIVDGRIWQQLYHLSSICTCGILVVVGSPTLALIDRKFPRAAYIGALASIPIKISADGAKSRVSLVMLETLSDFLLFLLYTCKKLSEDNILLPIKSVSKKDLKSLQVQTIATLPGIGEKMAQELLSHFGNIYNVVNASMEELAKVVGPKRAEKVYKFLRGG